MRLTITGLLIVGLLVLGPVPAVAVGALTQDLVAAWWMNRPGSAPELFRHNFWASPAGGAVQGTKNMVSGSIASSGSWKTATLGNRYGFVQRLPYTIVARSSVSAVPVTFAGLGGFSSSAGSTNDPFLYYLSAGNFQLGWTSGGTARNMTCTSILLGRPQVLWGVIRPEIVTCGRDHLFGASSVAAQATPNGDATRQGWFNTAANVSVEYVLLYARALSRDEIDYLVVNPYAWIPRGPSFVTTGVGGAPPSTLFSPFLVVPD